MQLLLTSLLSRSSLFDAISAIRALASGGAVVSSGITGGAVLGLVGATSGSICTLGMLALGIAANNRARRKELRSVTNKAYRRGRRDLRIELGLPVPAEDDLYDDPE